MSRRPVDLVTFLALSFSLANDPSSTRVCFLYSLSRLHACSLGNSYGAPMLSSLFSCGPARLFASSLEAMLFFWLSAALYLSLYSSLLSMHYPSFPANSDGDTRIHLFPRCLLSRCIIPSLRPTPMEVGKLLLRCLRAQLWMSNSMKTQDATRGTKFSSAVEHVAPPDDCSRPLSSRQLLDQ